MVKNKFFFHAFFGLSILLYILDIPVEIWELLVVIYIIINIIDIKNNFPYRLPLGELIALSFLIENSLALTLIELFDKKNVTIGQSFYLCIPIEEYLPFSFLACQAFLIGYKSYKKPGFIWIDFAKNIRQKISLSEIRTLIILGICGAVMASFNISELSNISYILQSFFTCALIGFALYTGKIANLYLIIGVIINLTITIYSGMFGSFIYFVIYYLLISGALFVANGKTIKWSLIIIIFLVGFYGIAMLQNVKVAYRLQTWQYNREGGSEAFYSTIKTTSTSTNPLDKNFYFPILYRLNQGYLVSAVMKKVPSQEPFAEGSTLFRTLIDAFIPRMFKPDREEAGGREKIKRFTNITLVGSTSMNIGILGESYANFGTGAIIFLLFYGIIIAAFESYVLIFSQKKPLLLIMFPIFFSVLFGSGTDFLLVVNTIVKSSIFILILLTFIQADKIRKILPLN